MSTMLVWYSGNTVNVGVKDKSINQSINQSNPPCLCLFRVIALERWIYDENLRVVKLYKIPTLLGYYIFRKVKNMCYAHGIGRHSQEQIYHIMEEDFKAFSNYLGKLLSKLDTVKPCCFKN